MSENPPDFDEESAPGEELHAISVALRAYVEWQELNGTTGFPREPRAVRVAPIHVSHEPSAAAPPEVVSEEEVQDSSPPPGRQESSKDAKGVETSSSGAHPSPGFDAPEARVTFEDDAPAERATPTIVTVKTSVSCTICARGEARAERVLERGARDALVCFVGLSTSDEGTALLDKMIAAMKLPAVRVLTLADFTPSEHTCSGPLEHAIAEGTARVLVALGSAALRALLGKSARAQRGQWKNYRGKLALMPTHGIDGLLKPGPTQATLKREAWADLQAVLSELAKSI